MVLYTGPKLDMFTTVVNKLTFKPDAIARKHLVDLLGRYPTGKVISHCEEGCRSKAKNCKKHGKKTAPC